VAGGGQKNLSELGGGGKRKKWPINDLFGFGVITGRSHFDREATNGFIVTDVG